MASLEHTMESVFLCKVRDGYSFHFHICNELIHEYNVKKLIRVGTCGALQKDVKVRDVILAQGATTDSSKSDGIRRN